MLLMMFDSEKMKPVDSHSVRLDQYVVIKSKAISKVSEEQLAQEGYPAIRS